eukprot:CAMPEP_0185818304 /NCGR_PEP_ID=MMETSP1322-20130828/20428_1 /TAXON_ID=265543 /ORGANISM="Minutocellus polymorphus, Strain RCC2270" /LENGTH=467 /DNA_ID=CAMNT_0028515403 /DNA_START=265 /DNA_END=1668 /DNA_ORIENTATION=-
MRRYDANRIDTDEVFELGGYSESRQDRQRELGNKSKNKKKKKSRTGKSSSSNKKKGRSKTTKGSKSSKSTSSSGGGREKRNRKSSNTKKNSRSGRKGPGSKTRKKLNDRAQELMEEENALFLAAFADNRGGMSMPTPRPRPPPVPTPRPPVSAPTIPTRCGISPQERRAEILAEVSKISDPDDLLTGNSPQRKALDFIVDEDVLRLCPDDPTLGQRYILSVFYYSTEGPNWSRCSKPNDLSNPEQVAADNARCNIRGDGSQFAGSDAWLTGVSECEWGGITCGDSGSGSAISLFTENINVGGVLPFELQDLEKLEVLHVEEGRTRGTIPGEFGNIKNLKELDLNFNQISGNIPDSIFGLRDLIELDLNDNRLTGELSGSIGGMPNLQFLQLQNNRMSGQLPDSLGQLTRLVILNVDENQFTGAMPQSVCERRDINGGRLASLTADCLNPEDKFYVQCDTPECCTMCF